MKYILIQTESCYFLSQRSASNKRKSINTSSQGNFVFNVQVQVPKRLTKEQRDLLTQLAKTMNEQPPVKKKGIFGF